MGIRYAMTLLAADVSSRVNESECFIFIVDVAYVAATVIRHRAIRPVIFAGSVTILEQ